MLGRYADNLYWMARYLERAENTARKIQAGLHYSITTKENNRNDLLEFLIEDYQIKVFKKKYNIASTLIANKRELDSYARGNMNVKFLSGWRFKIFGKLVQ